MGQNGKEGHLLYLRQRVSKFYTQLPAALVTILAAALSDEPEFLKLDASDDELRARLSDLLAGLTSAYVAGNDLADFCQTLPLEQRPNLPELSVISFALCNVVSNPVLSRTKLEELDSGSGAGGAATLFSVAPPQGKKKTLPPWLSEYLHGKPSKHDARLAEEIRSGAQKLVSNSGGVVVSRDVDFGIQRAAAKNSAERDQYGLPIIPDAPRYFRTVSISNQGTSEVVLLDVRALPEMEDKLRLHDDLRVVENSSQGGMGNGTAEGPVGVSLAPGAEYQVAVELRCIPQDAAHLQQWLLFSFIPASAAVPAPKPPTPTDEVFIIGRRISALIAKSLADMQTILSVEAIPFYPAFLRTLFDSPPATLLVGKKPALLASSRLVDILTGTSPPPAFKQMGALSYQPESLFTPGAAQEVALWQPADMKESGGSGSVSGAGLASQSGLQLGPQDCPPGLLDPPLNQPLASFMGNFNPSSGQQHNPNQPLVPFPNQQGIPFPTPPFSPALGPFPYQPFSPYPNQPFHPFAHQPFNSFPNQPLNPFLNQPFNNPVVPHPANPFANHPANPSFNQQFPPLGSPTGPPRPQPNPAPQTPFTPGPVTPPAPITPMEIQQLVFWLNSQMALMLQQSRFANPQQAFEAQASMQQGAELYFQKYCHARSLQLHYGAPPPFPHGQGPFTPGPFPPPFGPVQSLRPQSPLPGPSAPGQAPGTPSNPGGVNAPSPPHPSGVTAPSWGPRPPLNFQPTVPVAPPSTPDIGRPKRDLASELGLPHDLSPEPVPIPPPAQARKGKGKAAGDGETKRAPARKAKKEKSLPNEVGKGPVAPSKKQNLQQTESRPSMSKPERLKSEGNGADIEDGDHTRPLSGTGVCECPVRQLQQLSRLLAMEETAMEKDIKAHDLYNTRLKLQPKTAPEEVHLFALEVPGLPENRPSVLYADLVYLRPSSAPRVEYAAFVWAVEMRPNPQVLLAISEDFVKAAKLPVKKSPAESAPGWARALVEESVHARFTFDRLLLKRMHVALAKAALASFALLPCTCGQTANQPVNSPPNSSFGAHSDLSNPTSSTAHQTQNHILRTSGLRQARNRLFNGFNGPEKNWADSFEPINIKLNEQQRQAVGTLLAESCGRGPYIIFGPPGTGKTVTMVEMCLQLLRRAAPGARLCVCAPSNFAADIVCSGIAAGGDIGPDVMWRLNDPRRTLASVKADVVRFCKYDSTTGLFDVQPDPSSYRIIVCTCGGAALLQEPPLADKAGSFTHILIDEAGQALVPETLIAFGLAEEDSKLVLCGDPRQLGPVVHSPVAAQHGLAQSLLECYMKAAERDADTRAKTRPKPLESAQPPTQLDILRRLLFREGDSSTSVNEPLTDDGPEAEFSHQTHVVKLVHNYRSHRKLLELPSRMFYKDELVATAEEASVEPPRNWEEMQGSDFPMLFYGVKGQQMREGEAPSYFNPLEAERLVNLLAGLLQRVTISTGDIGVMAPYRKQVQKLRLLLRERGLGAVRVGTVDDYQGQEERVIFISTVLTRPESLRRGAKQGPDGSIGFLGNAKRFNVAITRAKALLVVVGHPVVLLEDENWRQLLMSCMRRDAYRGAGAEMVPRYVRHGGADWTVEGGDEEEEYDEGDDDIADAVGRIAELSLLGLGDVDRMFPEGLDSEYSAFSEDLEWRVVL